MSLITLLGFGAAAQSLKQAEAYFKSGKFADAEKVYAEVLNTQPDNLQALISIGYISLLCNKLDQAERWLSKAKALKGKPSAINHLLGEVYYRKKDFVKAAPCFKAIGRHAMAKKLESFKGQVPYQTENPFDEVRIQFIVTDPLPFIKIIINEQYSGNFILDTGGGELILDSEFAKQAGADIFGDESASGFGGGKTGTLLHGKISSLSLEGFKVSHVPASILPFRHIELAGMKIDGVVGTVFLYQFLSCIDYKNGQLILRNKEKYRSENFPLQAPKPSAVEFWMAGDHFMLSCARVNSSDTMLFLIDTGLESMAFTAPKSTLKKLGINVDKSRKATGTGGGGNFAIYPFDVDQICLGPVCVEKLHGQYGPFPSQIKNAFGMRIDGLLSHEFFRNKTLIIDFGEMKFYID